MRTVSATYFRQNMFQLLLQAVETGEPIVIAFTRKEKGKTKTTLCQIQFVPE